MQARWLSPYNFLEKLMRIKNLAVAAAVAFAASSALADDQTLVLTQTGPGTFSGAFSDTHLRSGLFVDTFIFNLPGLFGATLGSGALTFASLSGSISLVIASLEAANGVSVASPPDPASIAIPSTLSFASASGPLTLSVVGFAGDAFSDPVALTASYGGMINFSTAVAPVPEPETYGLMLAGLASVGFAARRRRANDRRLV